MLVGRQAHERKWIWLHGRLGYRVIGAHVGGFFFCLVGLSSSGLIKSNRTKLRMHIPTLIITYTKIYSLSERVKSVRYFYKYLSGLVKHIPLHSRSYATNDSDLIEISQRDRIVPIDSRISNLSEGVRSLVMAGLDHGEYSCKLHTLWLLNRTSMHQSAVRRGFARSQGGHNSHATKNRATLNV